MDGWADEDGLERMAVAGSFAYADGELSNGYADENIGGDASGELSGGGGSFVGKADTTTGRGEGNYETSSNGGGFTVEFDLDRKSVV